VRDFDQLTKAGRNGFANWLPRRPLREVSRSSPGSEPAATGMGVYIDRHADDLARWMTGLSLRARLI
jgi:hypothetical protein